MSVADPARARSRGPAPPGRRRPVASPRRAARRMVLAGPIVAGVTGHRRAVRDRRGGRPAARPRPRRRAVPRARRLRRRRCSSGSTSRSARPGAQRQRAARRARRWRAVRRERWTPARAVAAGTALISFYVTYMAYRNLKAIVPLLRPDDIFDRQLADLDRSMFLGHDPADAAAQRCSATGVPTHILSTFYAAFIVFLPLSLAVALVFSRDIRAGLFYATALSVNWVLGAAQLLPAARRSGPIYYEPRRSPHLPHSEVTRLQDMLLDQRVEFLAHPTTATPQSIAAFASLHISMSLTAVLGGPPARARAGGSRSRCGSGSRMTHARHGLPRLALLPRRPRRHRDRGRGARGRPAAHGHRPARTAGHAALGAARG